MFVFELLYPIYFEVVYKEIGQYYIKDDEILTYIGSVGFMGMSFVKLFAGISLDYVSVKKVNSLLLAIFIIHIFTLQYTIQNW